jgi:hypothetical protein
VQRCIAHAPATAAGTDAGASRASSWPGLRAQGAGRSRITAHASGFRPSHGGSALPAVRHRDDIAPKHAARWLRAAYAPCALVKTVLAVRAWSADLLRASAILLRTTSRRRQA